MIYKRLLAEMLVKGYTKKDLAQLLNKSESTIKGRFYGKTDFTLNEAITIRKAWFEDCTANYLFSRE